jgi:hypothetical protein
MDLLSFYQLPCALYAFHSWWWLVMSFAGIFAEYLFRFQMKRDRNNDIQNIQSMQDIFWVMCIPSYAMLSSTFVIWKTSPRRPMNFARWKSRVWGVLNQHFWWWLHHCCCIW